MNVIVLKTGIRICRMRENESTRLSLGASFGCVRGDKRSVRTRSRNRDTHRAFHPCGCGGVPSDVVK